MNQGFCAEEAFKSLAGLCLFEKTSSKSEVDIGGQSEGHRQNHGTQ